MELVSISQMQKADKYTIESLGIPGRTLMFNAAESVAKEVLFLTEGTNNFKAAVFCGPGNNGGDGWATALILHEIGLDITVFSGNDPTELSGDALFFADKAVKSGITAVVKKSPQSLKEFDVVVDAVFGIGLNRKISGIYEDFILLMNQEANHIISVDIPSGLYSDNGNPYDTAVKADLTLCFGKPKVALFTQPGCSYTKKLTVYDIGIPEEAYQVNELSFTFVDMDFVKKRIKSREKISSKGKYGKVLIAAGSPGMTGAISLCAESCFRSGAGLVYCAVPKSKLFEYDTLIREAISIPVEDCGKGYISSDSILDIVRAAVNKSAVVIGPGLSSQSNSGLIFKELRNNSNIPLIVDAQTLNDISGNLKLLKNANNKTIITPHPGEMARLTRKPISYIQENRISTAVKFAQTHNVIVLLKGHRTIVTDGSNVYINSSGNPGMATAGSGDVLCGVIAAISAVVENMTEAAAIAAFIHGLAGDKAAEVMGEYGMKAGDILMKIPQVIKDITGA